MILKLVLIPSLFLIAGLVLLGFAMLAPDERVHVRPRMPDQQPSDRIRRLEVLAQTPAGLDDVRDALDDPDPQVAAVAAVLLRDRLPVPNA